MTVRTILTAGLILLAALTGTGGAQQLYEIRDLGFQRFPESINESGTIVGHVLECYGCIRTYAFVDDVNGQRSLELPRGGASKAQGVNNRGDIVGWSLVPVIPGPGAVRHAILWPAGRPVTEAMDLDGLHIVGVPFPSQSEAFAINDEGVILGYAGIPSPDPAAGEPRVARWRFAPGPEDLGSGIAVAINDAGDGVGFTCPGGSCGGFLLAGGISAIGSIFPSDINDTRRIVGTTQGARGFLYDGGVVTEIGTLGGNNSALKGVNNAGDAVGVADSTDAAGQHAILVRNGNLYDLNLAIPYDGEWHTLLEATAINERGQIVGNGFYRDGFQHGFVLTPIDRCGPTTTSTTTTSTTTIAPAPTSTTSTTMSTTTTLPGVAAQRITGEKITLKDNVKAAKRTAIVQSGDPTISLGGGNGSGDDPTVVGATVRIHSLAGGFDATYSLPARHWKPIGKPGENEGYRYKDKNLLDGPVKAAIVKAAKQVKIQGQGASLSLALGVDPSPVEVRMTLGSTGYCLRFGGAPEFTAGKSFTVKNAPAPASCSP